MAVIKSTSTKSTNSYSLLEKDVYDARIAKVIFLGSQKQRAYQGKAKADAIEVQLTLEIIGETTTQTNAEGEKKEFPATLNYKITAPAGGCSMGKMAALLSAAIGHDETLNDTMDYEQLVGKAVSVSVGQYTSQATGKTHNCVDAIAALGKRTKESLPLAQTDLVFFCCYEDSDTMKNAWTKLFPYVKDMVRKSPDAPHIPALVNEWPDQAEEDADPAAKEDDKEEEF